MNEHSDPKHESQRAAPLWRHAHKDWRFLAVIVMIAAMALYLMSDDLRLQPKPPSQPPQSGNAVE
jgi:hypothetical protein